MRTRLPFQRSARGFEISADPRTAFESTAFRSAFLAVVNAIAVRAGLAVLIGDAGCGKTLLLRAVRDLRIRMGCPAVLRHASAGGEPLVALFEELRLVPEDSSRSGHFDALARYLAQRPGPAVLLIDGAEELTNDQLTELAALAAWRRGEPDSLQVVLAGRPDFLERLQQPPLAAVARQIGVRSRLGALLPQEIGHYVAHHLALGGGGGVSFGAAALTRLFAYSRGVPLKVNLLCVCVLARKCRRVGPGHIDEAARYCGLAPEPPDPATAAQRGTPAGLHRSAMRRSGSRMARFGYGTAALAGLAGVAAAIPHLVQPVEDIARRALRLVMAPQSLAAAATSLKEAGARIVPAILTRLADSGTVLPRSAAVAAPADAAPPIRGEALAEGDARAADSPPVSDTQRVPTPDQPPVAESPAAADADRVAAPDEPASADAPAVAMPDPANADRQDPVATHIWPGTESDDRFDAAEPDRSEVVESVASPADEPAVPPTSEATTPAADVAATTPADAPAGAIETPATGTAAAPRGEDLDTERLMRRGHALLQQGDIASARLLFERAADAGHAAALTGLGRSFDPLELRQLGVIGIKGDPDRALEWYRAAAGAGDPSAEAHGARLSGWLQSGQGRR